MSIFEKHGRICGIKKCTLAVDLFLQGLSISTPENVFPFFLFVLLFFIYFVFLVRTEMNVFDRTVDFPDFSNKNLSVLSL